MRYWTLIALIALLLLACHRKRKGQQPVAATLPAASVRTPATTEPGPAPATEPVAPYGSRPPSAAPAAPAAPPAALASSPGAPSRPAAPTESETAAMVDAHNRARAKHCAPPLAWSTKLAQVAQKWANALRDKGCVFGHSGTAAYGENLAAGTIGTLDAEAIVKMWYDEIAEYKFPNGGFSMKTGHFTQVVWKGTRQIGCGRSQCRTMEIWVCNYERAGNWDGQYRANVLPLGCK